MDSGFATVLIIIGVLFIFFFGLDVFLIVAFVVILIIVIIGVIDVFDDPLARARKEKFQKRQALEKEKKLKEPAQIALRKKILEEAEQADVFSIDTGDIKVAPIVDHLWNSYNVALRGDYHNFNKFDGYGRRIEITKGPTWGQHIFGIVNSVEMPQEIKNQLDYIRQLVVFKYDYNAMPDLTEGRYDTSVVSKKTPSLNPSKVEKMYGEYFSKGIDEKINSPNERLFDENMDGIAYEHFCADILRDHHWKVQVLPASNDHGADLIGQKNGTSVAIQCKRYSKPYGNSAVQEVTAAMRHYGTDFGIVVSNQQGTSGAKTLAKSNDVSLLNHDDLENLSEFLSI